MVRNIELWQRALHDLHGAGLMWPGIARGLGVGREQVKYFAHNDGVGSFNARGMAITYDRGRCILRIHSALCPEKRATIEPLLAEAPTLDEQAIARALQMTTRG